MASYTDTVRAHIRPQATAGTTQNTVVGNAPFAGVISAAALVPNAALTGDPTNNRIFTLKNKTQGLTAATLTTTASQVYGTSVPMVLSGTPANLVVAAGDQIVLEETVGGTGVVHNGYFHTVSVARTDQP